MGATQLGTELGAEEVAKIIAFLRTLTGVQPQVTYPTLPPSVPTTPVRPRDQNAHVGSPFDLNPQSVRNALSSY